MQKQFEDLDLLNEYMGLYIEVLPFVVSKNEDNLKKDEIPSFDQFKERWPFHYQHQVTRVDYTKLFFNPVDGYKELKGSMSIDCIPKKIGDAIIFIPQLPERVRITQTYRSIKFAGKHIKTKIH